MRSPRRTCPPALPGASGRRKPVVRVLPPDFLKTELRGSRLHLCGTGYFFFQLRVTMFPSGWRLPLPGKKWTWFRAQERHTTLSAAHWVSNHRRAHGCSSWMWNQDGRRQPPQGFLKTPRCQGSEHPPHVSHMPHPQTHSLTRTHTSPRITAQGSNEYSSVLARRFVVLAETKYGLARVNLCGGFAALTTGVTGSRCLRLAALLQLDAGCVSV